MRATLSWQSMLLFGFLALSACNPGRAQVSDGSLTIRVEARRVLVPVTLWDTSEWAPIFETLPADRFRLFEDGKEQKIESVEKIPILADERNVRDNLGLHGEWEGVPKGKWSTSDVPRRPLSVDYWYYEIAYVPPPSPEGSCHHIRIKVARADTKVLFTRDEYCNVPHSSSDLLRGTPIGKSLEQYIASDAKGRINPSAQASYFYTAPGRARVHIDIAFPEAMPKKWSEGTLPLDLLIIANGKDGKMVARHSADVWGDPDFGRKAELHSIEEAGALYIPTRYDAQTELPPGEYRLAIAVSHGPKFGVTEVPLTIENYDGKQLAISSIALCKRVREAGHAPVAAEFVPLVSRGFEFTPAADTRFHKGDSVMVYFQLYEPSPSGPEPSSAPVQFQMRVTDPKSGAVVLKTELSAAPWIQPGSSTIPIDVRPVLDNLAPGQYRLEVQASDSAGRSTPWRAANFSIE